MKMKSVISFTEEYIPPRCRKSRMREQTAVVQLTIKECSSEEAPVAIREEGFLRGMATKTGWVEYRWYKNNLYRRVLMAAKVSGGEGFWDVNNLVESLSKHNGCYFNRGAGKEAVKKELLAEARNHIIIDDNEVWVKTAEPRYVIATFGLGHNHGGTSLMVDHGYNPNIRKDFYFNALERDQAIATCKQVAIQRGDSNSVAHIGDFWRLEVLLPEAVRVKPNSYTKRVGGNDFLAACEDLICSADSAGTAGLLVLTSTALGHL